MGRLTHGTGAGTRHAAGLTPTEQNYGSTERRRRGSPGRGYLLGAGAEKKVRLPDGCAVIFKAYGTLEERDVYTGNGDEKMEVV